MWSCTAAPTSPRWRAVASAAIPAHSDPSVTSRQARAAPPRRRAAAASGTTTVNAESPFQPLNSAPASIEMMSPGSSTRDRRDAVHDLLVHRRADRVAVAAHHLEVRLRAATGDDSGCRGIQLQRRDTGCDQRAHRVERGGRDQAGLDHRAQLSGRLVDRPADRQQTDSRQAAAERISPRPSSAAMTRSVISSSVPTPSISSTMPRSRYTSRIGAVSRS